MTSNPEDKDQEGRDEALRLTIEPLLTAKEVATWLNMSLGVGIQENRKGLASFPSSGRGDTV